MGKRNISSPVQKDHIQHGKMKLLTEEITAAKQNFVQNIRNVAAPDIEGESHERGILLTQNRFQPLRIPNRRRRNALIRDHSSLGIKVIDPHRGVRQHSVIIPGEHSQRLTAERFIEKMTDTCAMIYPGGIFRRKNGLSHGISSSGSA
jgi:hypothetical protein